jgi:hypothetical protein
VIPVAPSVILLSMPNLWCLAEQGWNGAD